MTLTHLMLDIETLDNKPSAAITELSAVRFDPVTGDVLSEFQGYINAPLGTVSTDTVMWWLTQSDEARTALVDGVRGGRAPHIVAAEFRNWVRRESDSVDDVRVWGNGASFDVPIVESLFREVGVSTPWKYFGHRCYRTLVALAGSPKLERSGDHIGLADCHFQVRRLRASMQVLGLTDLT